METLSHQRGFEPLQRVDADFIPDRKTVGRKSGIDIHAFEPGEQLAGFLDVFRIAMVKSQFAVLACAGLRNEGCRTLARFSIAQLITQLARLFRRHSAHRTCPAISA